MKRKIKLALIASALLVGIKLQAQEIKISGEIRPRFEYRHGFQTVADSGQNAASFIDQRTRLNLDYKSTGFQSKIVFQDVRVWGNQKTMVGNQDFGASIHEAWGEAFLTKKLSLKFGRQEMGYDDERILGAVGWAQQARSHDGLIFKYKVDSTSNLHFGLAMNRDKATLFESNSSISPYKAMQFLWYHNDFSENLSASVLFLNHGKEVFKPDSSEYATNYSQTIGTRVNYKKNKFYANLNFYYQMGKMGKVFEYKDDDLDKEFEDTKISAMNIGLDLNYKVSENVTATLGYEYLSGQSQTDTSKAYREVNHAFTPFYGTNHKFNGLMDHFYVGNWVNSVGLQDIFIKLKYAKNKRWVGFDWHMFSSAADIRDINETEIKAMSSSLGMEFDITAGMNLAEGVDLKFGYSHLLPTETLAYMKGTTTVEDNKVVGRIDQMNNWAWAMITIKPVFFEKK